MTETTEAPAQRNVYQRINEVRRAVSYVQKDATVQGYKAVTHDQVTAHVRDQLITSGLVIVPSVDRDHVEQVGQTSKGTPIIRYQCQIKVEVVNVDDPQDKVTMFIPAHANDSGDKAPGKAISYAVKVAMLKLFSLETGVNDEGRVEERDNAVMTHLMEEVTGYVDANDALAINLLSRALGQETWANIFNEAPTGKKQAWKKTLVQMEATGLDVLQAINTALTTNDAGKAKENTEDMTEGGRRLLANYLGRERSQALGALLSTLNKGEGNE